MSADRPTVCGAGGCTNTNPPKTYAERMKCFYDGTPCSTDRPTGDDDLPAQLEAEEGHPCAAALDRWDQARGQRRDGGMSGPLRWCAWMRRVWRQWRHRSTQNSTGP